MSELKAYWIPTRSGNSCHCYLKSEADKVIKELKEGAKNLILDNYLKDQEIKHHKYKRCLAMARWCLAIKELNRYGDQDYMDFAEKWHRRWLELAKKFEEAK